MSVISDIINIAKDVVSALKPKPKPWRWGHAYLPGDSTQCIYCHKYIPGKVKHTPTACPGPDHKLTSEELGRNK